MTAILTDELDDMFFLLFRENCHIGTSQNWFQHSMPGGQVDQVYRPVRRQFLGQDTVGDRHGTQDDAVQGHSCCFHGFLLVESIPLFFCLALQLAGGEFGTYSPASSPALFHLR